MIKLTTLIIATVCLTLITITALTVPRSILKAQDRKATYQCLAWYNDMLENDKMFMANWQQMQCSYYGIDLNQTPNGE